MGKQLKREIHDHLVTTLGMKPNVVTVRLSEIKREHPQLTPAAAAAELARRKGKSIMRFLDDDDKKSFASIKSEISFSPIIIRAPSRNTAGKRTPPKPILVFPSPDPFIERHIAEINGTYHASCYTATFILCRKVMENLIAQVLKKKFTSAKNRILYEDPKNRRSLDFSVVLGNLYKSRTRFSITGSSAIERIKQKATSFKDDANDKTHSLFHIASKTEIEEANVQEIFDLISIVMKEVGL